MIDKVKKFFTHKRCKSRLNNKGFSLIEIMVALGLITLLVGLAIPQYTTYRKRVKAGVVKSMLLIPFRTMDIEDTLGSTSSVDKNKLYDAIKSKARDEFDPAYNTNTAGGWCFSLTDKTPIAPGDDYANFSGCIDNSGVPKVGGIDIDCAEAKTFRYIKTGGATPACETINCPTNCVIDGAAIITTCPSSMSGKRVGEKLDERGCKAGTQASTYNGDAECIVGVCELK